MKRYIAVVLLLGLFIISCNRTEERDLLGMDFPAIEELSRDTTVSFYMWGGSPTINDWVTNYVGESVYRSHGISLNMVPINDASEFIKKLATEKIAELETGTADLVWINGENFKNAREGDLLFGPYTSMLPNMEQYVDMKAAESDFGYPVEGYETPYGRAQFVFEYDTAIIQDPPESFAELKEWIKANPGRFTYPEPPDFTGSAFIRQAFYELAGGHEQFIEGYDGTNINEELFNEKSQPLWDYFNEIKPFLWQQGESYPKTITVLETLFSRGEVAFSMFYSPSHATSKILEGQYKDSVRTFVMMENSIANTHFTAIPFNAPNKAGAMVVSNFLISAEAQLHKADPQNWGDLPIVDYNKLSSAEKKQFDDLDLGLATLPVSVLGENAVPEIPSAYVELLETGWERHVLGK